MDISLISSKAISLSIDKVFRFMTAPLHSELNKVLVPLSIEVGKLIMHYYDNGFEVDYKSDESPVTIADQAAENVILNDLQKHWPHITIVAEEMCAAGKIPQSGEMFFLVDALDGTKEFINKRDDFTVNIALIVQGVPYYGLVFAPALGELFVCLEDNIAGRYSLAPQMMRDKNFKLDFNAIDFTKVRMRTWPQAGPSAVVSRSHLEQRTIEFLNKNKALDKVSAGSSLKFCRLAEGLADLYPRFSPTMEWDTAAGHGILLAAGGSLLEMSGAPFLYGKYETRYKNTGFIAAARDKLSEIELLPDQDEV